MESTISFPNLGDGLTFTIDRVAFSFNLFGHQVDIYWYGILIAVGMLLAVLYAMRNAKRLDVNSDRLLDVIWAASSAASSAPGFITSYLTFRTSPVLPLFLISRKAAWASTAG